MIKKINGPIIVICGPSGTGKTTLVTMLCERLGFVRSISATTRDPRPGEVHGVDYHFHTRSEFERKVEAGEFVEWALVHGQHYGTLFSEISRAIESQLQLILNVDINGFHNVKCCCDRALAESVVGIFLLPPSIEVLKRRLEERKDTTESEIKRRLAAASQEIQLARELPFNHFVITEYPEKTFITVRHIIGTYPR